MVYSFCSALFSIVDGGEGPGFEAGMEKVLLPFCFWFLFASVLTFPLTLF